MDHAPRTSHNETIAPMKGPQLLAPTGSRSPGCAPNEKFRAFTSKRSADRACIHSETHSILSYAHTHNSHPNETRQRRLRLTGFCLKEFNLASVAPRLGEQDASRRTLHQDLLTSILGLQVPRSRKTQMEFLFRGQP